MRLLKSSSLPLSEEADDKYSKNHLSLLFPIYWENKPWLPFVSAKYIYSFFFVKGVMGISAIMSELFSQLVSMPNGFAPLFIHEQYLIASHILYFPIAHNTLCLPRKFCISHCF